jgi:hypothetical protein
MAGLEPRAKPATPKKVSLAALLTLDNACAPADDVRLARHLATHPKIGTMAR